MIGVGSPKGVFGCCVGRTTTEAFFAHQFGIRPKVTQPQQRLLSFGSAEMLVEQNGALKLCGKDVQTKCLPSTLAFVRYRKMTHTHMYR